MSTRAKIVFVDENNIAHSIYCHNDGYPQWVGRILKTAYSNEERIRKLISYGNMSSLRTEINPSPNAPHKVSSITFDNCQPDVCIFYHRDRGDEWEYTKPIEFKYTIKNMRKYIGDDIDYTYVWYNNKWNIYLFGSGTLMELTDDICTNGLSD